MEQINKTRREITMNLLFITRKIDKNDALAGFTYQWVSKFAEKVDTLNVICLEKGDISGLPETVKIFSLGKERRVGKLRKFWNFQKYAFQFVKKSDGIFCHQNPIYTILIASWAKLYRKKIVTWYTHGKVGFQLRLVNLLADVILTASPESFRLPSKKVIVTGHGIDTDFFRPAPTTSYKSQVTSYKILSIGRISPAKDYEPLIEAINILVNKNNIKNIQVNIIGAPGLKTQEDYLKKLKDEVENKNLSDYISFLGPKPYPELPWHYQECDLFVNLSRTGSVDKAVLEAMACGKIVLTSNEAFADILKDKGAYLMVKPRVAEDLAEKIIAIMNLSENARQDLGRKLREEVIKNHNLDKLIEKITRVFKE